MSIWRVWTNAWLLIYAQDRGSCMYIASTNGHKDILEFFYKNRGEELLMKRPPVRCPYLLCLSGYIRIHEGWLYKHIRRHIYEGWLHTHICETGYIHIHVSWLHTHIWRHMYESWLHTHMKAGYIHIYVRLVTYTYERDHSLGVRIYHVCGYTHTWKRLSGKFPCGYTHVHARTCMS